VGAQTCTQELDSLTQVMQKLKSIHGLMKQIRMPLSIKNSISS
jgi:hypothetical protein